MNAASMPGRSTLTATSSPSAVTARCTWAIEAAATASSSNSAKTSSRRQSSSSSMVFLASPLGNGGRRSCSWARSDANSSPTRSERTESAWPSFTKAGPSSWNAADSFSPGRLDRAPRTRGVPRSQIAIRSPAFALTGSNAESASWRASVRTMRHMRRRFLRPWNIAQVRQAECRAAMPALRLR